MNVEIGTEAVQFPEKEYRNRIFIAVCESHLNIARYLRGAFICVSSLIERTLSFKYSLHQLQNFPNQFPSSPLAPYDVK